MINEVFFDHTLVGKGQGEAIRFIGQEILLAVTLQVFQ